jgi:uncharacterized membrane protein YedE/YeeE
MSAQGMSLSRFVAVLAAGALFGFGLALSTMVRPEVVLGFALSGLWPDAGDGRRRGGDAAGLQAGAAPAGTPAAGRQLSCPPQRLEP